MSELEPVSLAGNRATALALVFSELLQNALEHGGEAVQIELASETAKSCWRSPTTAPASRARPREPAYRSCERWSETSSKAA